VRASSDDVEPGAGDAAENDSETVAAAAGSDRAGTSDPLTTLHVRRARAGDADSLAWVVERFTPLLLAQARYRLGPTLARAHEPADLVQDVWAVALAALPKLEGRAERATPTLVAFLSRTLLLRVAELARRRIRRAGREGAPEAPDPLAACAAETRGVLTRLAGDEAIERVREAIESLPDADREVLILRGFEQHENHVAARLLGQTPNAVSLRYNRALERLRQMLPGGVFDELGEG